MTAELTTITSTFEDTDLITINYKGKPCWIAQDVGRTLGYEGPTALTDLIRDKWAAEVDEGEDYLVLRGQELKQFKALLPPTLHERVSRAANLTLLFESGIHAVCLKTTKPLGVKLRKFLAREVLPEIRESGSYKSELSASESSRHDDFIERVRAIEAYLVVLRANQELSGRAYARYAAQDAFHRLGGPPPLPMHEEAEEPAVPQTKARRSGPRSNPQLELPWEHDARYYSSRTYLIVEQRYSRATAEKWAPKFGVFAADTWRDSEGCEPEQRPIDVNGVPRTLAVYPVSKKDLLDLAYDRFTLWRRQSLNTVS